MTVTDTGMNVGKAFAVTTNQMNICCHSNSYNEVYDLMFFDAAYHTLVELTAVSPAACLYFPISFPHSVIS